MAKFINFKVVGGISNNGSGTPSPQFNGDNLILARSIIGIDVEIASQGEMTCTMKLNLPSGIVTCNAICATSMNPADEPKNFAPTSPNYINKVKAAIVRAIKSKPGATEVDCVLPQDSENDFAPYNPDLQVYWRSFNLPAVTPNLGPPLTDATIQQAVVDAITLDRVNASIPIPIYGLMADWNTSQVTNFNNLFSASNPGWPITDPVKAYQFVGGGINNWDTRNVTSMIGTFRAALRFNESIASWNTGKVTNMTVMFADTDDFNQPLNSWDVSKVQFFTQMFMDTGDFNQDLNNWDTSSATNMEFMFSNAGNNNPFNGDVTTWDVSNVGTGQFGIAFGRMFENCDNFDQDISGWNVSNGTGFNGMFDGAAVFNQDLSSWDMSSAISVRDMFQRASTYNQDLSGWNAPSVQDCRDFANLATSWTLPKPSFPASGFCP